jgi:hypothetical protein
MQKTKLSSRQLFKENNLRLFRVAFVPTAPVRGHRIEVLFQVLKVHGPFSWEAELNVGKP